VDIVISATASIVAILLSFALTYTSLRYYIRFAISHGITGKDVHKPGQPEVAEMGGVCIVAGITIGLIFLFPFVLENDSKIKVLSVILTLAIITTVGLIDDLKTLSAFKKTVLTLLGGIPLLLLKAYYPYIKLPFAGFARLHYVYPLLIPLAIAVTSNAVNMMDVFNGVMPLTSLIVLTCIALTAIINGYFNELVLCLVVMASLIAYLPYNRYPAKVFSGDTGSLSVGALIGVLSIICKAEVIALIAFMPFILNGFHTLMSIRGLKERSKIIRPTIINEEYKLEINKDPRAPIVLASLFLINGPADEKTLIKCYVAATLFSALLALFTIYLTYR
jgi:UDP-N-acetylglucosamine--dolichyl-phosphate N-acetylglucosaminephosphotransferase